MWKHEISAMERRSGTTSGQLGREAYSRSPQVGRHGQVVLLCIRIGVGR